jgi:hypothetical protein
MNKLKLIKVQGTTYSILGLYSGYIYLGNPYNVNNNVVRDGVIWEMQPFCRELPQALTFYYTCIRFFKTNTFGRSCFKDKLKMFKK